MDEKTLNKVNDPSVQTADGELVDRAARGDRDAKRLLFERFREAAYVVAFRVTGRAEDALDVVQDAFIRAFESLGDFQRDASFKTWLLRIVTNRGLDLLRARKVRLAVPIDGDEDESRPQPAGPEEGDDPAAGMEQQELAARIASAVDALPPEQRAVFALFATGELSYAQIAETLGIPIGTVMSRLFHARRQLKSRLADLE